MFKKICLLFLLVFTSLNIFSEEKIEDLPREKSSSLGKWEVVPAVKSVEEKKFKGDKSEVRLRRDKKVFVRKARNKSRPLLSVDSEDEAQVVYNPDRKSLGTVNGTIIVNLVNPADEKDLLKEFPLKKLRLERKIKVGIYKVKAGNDINQVAENLKKDPRVKSVEVEVISNSGGLKPL